MKNTLYLLCLSMVLLTNCNKSKNKFVEKDLEGYVDRFFAEAEARDLDITDDDLEVVFRDLSEEGVCGLGYFKFEGTDLRKVEINPDFFCWGFHDDWGRESLVFHELGHAILRKIHVNTSLPNGLPSTMMCDGNRCNVFGYYDKYTQGKRAYYLDKLFKPGTPTPDWAKIKRNPSLFFEEKIETNTPLGQLEFSDLKISTNFSSAITVNPVTQSKNIELRVKDQIPNGATGSWVIRLDNPVIEEGLGLKLQAKIATENMEGEGVAMLVRTLSGDVTSLDISGAATSRNTHSITGNQAEKLYEVNLDYYPSDVRQIALIFQILPNTSGTAYLDDIRLEVMEVVK
ncbi:MAG: hypothetical protein AB8G86_23855 [Saprospiraceae bacterium]